MGCRAQEHFCALVALRPNKMSKTFRKSSYWVAGAISGTVWFFIALGLDWGWAIPTHRALHLGAAILAAVATGELISLVFRTSFQRARVPMFLLLPCATLPMAITAYVEKLPEGFRVRCRYHANELNCTIPMKVEHVNK